MAAGPEWISGCDTVIWALPCKKDLQKTDEDQPGHWYHLTDFWYLVTE